MRVTFTIFASVPESRRPTRFLAATAYDSIAVGLGRKVSINGPQSAGNPLSDSLGQIIAEDDDSGGDSNARIPETGAFTLPASGTYTIQATSWSQGETGNYIGDI